MSRVRIDGRSVFLSGPMSGIQNLNAGAFAEAHMMLRKAGAEKVYDPTHEAMDVPDIESREFWMKRCLHELTIRYGGYDLLVSLPGWEDSEGARIERTVAEACGIEVCELSEVTP